ncbi:hypothetical protein [Corallococcus macrosporus]|uniref:Lipoprotein n=1 Tax=Myxococcus fulvus (strain ATCC BAA-855 / HW-1) TaxID=483219 RepID=F8C792_MYXFH|nr:hypothetical protein [Corallococcus macrosporus]AEI61968.1 hypothetical protein LILAB_00160 [Corallococcus macrosporus]
MRNVSTPTLLLSICAIGLILAVGAAWWMGRTSILVVNASERELWSLEVKFPGRTCRYEAVAPQAEVLCEGRADRDGDVEVSYRFDEGGELGVFSTEYVNPTLGWQGSMVLRPDGTIDVTRAR